ncbi:lipid-A-disaccharide synthase-related protein [Okeania sp. SIO3B5]|uniref:lipid-A-disaccharide synthase-related protein n=1 Tax=Okeania sp. SIO3B5 TaxID=2607811 RepID=UPI0025DE62DB|nr:lipid-A-disaccharide synthase-related protein [Okeania sp. SIO3B5]
MTLKILCLSNGHGEDAIAVQIVQELQKYPLPPSLAALPIVGEGYAYTKMPRLSIIGPRQKMPSGGFIYMDGQQLWQDVKGGLLKMTFTQLKALKYWISSETQLGHQVVIFAVGDLVPLLFAWLSGVPYAFLGTAKSEYLVRDKTGKLASNSWVESFQHWSKSVYFPWECWLMSRSKCRAVLARDDLTAQILRKKSIRSYYLGNPMMDGVKLENSLLSIDRSDAKILGMQSQVTITLLPGSRSPEVYANWEIIIQAVVGLLETFPQQKFLFLGAIAPNLSLEPFITLLQSYHWQTELEMRTDTQNSILQLPVDRPVPTFFFGEGNIQFPVKLTSQNKNASMILDRQAFPEFLHRGNLAIAMAGTATEQFVGLGKPAIAIPGNGPQFTSAFAEAQSRLLGISIILVKHPKEVADAVKSLLNDPERLQLITKNGVQRMGKPGAAQRIANFLMELNWM